jgi:hypothetical protein
VKSRTTARFRDAFAQLPPPIQAQARRAYQRFKQNPQHPSLRFKKAHEVQPVYSVRINLDYRAIGVQIDDQMVWFWIGCHAAYERLLRTLSRP